MLLQNLIEDFNGTTLDSVKWGTYLPVGGFTVTVSGGVCNNNTAASTVGEAQLYSQTLAANPLTLTESYIQAKITVQAGTTSVDTAFKIYGPGDTDAVYMVYSNTQLYASKTVASVDSNITNIAYNSTTMAYWRIRESGGTVYYEYGPDGQTWTQLSSVTTWFDATRVRFLFTANEWSSDVNATVGSTIDKINIGQAPIPGRIYRAQGFQ